eukprot:SAG31_NODE_30770_length_376_cov_0.931408_1_plen_46_part_10
MYERPPPTDAGGFASCHGVNCAAAAAIAIAIAIALRAVSPHVSWWV